jgi:ammonium transporter, Amt family
MHAIDPAATAWLLASTALVLLITPGLAIFYGGKADQPAGSLRP